MKADAASCADLRLLIAAGDFKQAVSHSSLELNKETVMVDIARIMLRAGTMNIGQAGSG